MSTRARRSPARMDSNRYHLAGARGTRNGPGCTLSWGGRICAWCYLRRQVRGPALVAARDPATDELSTIRTPAAASRCHRRQCRSIACPPPSISVELITAPAAAAAASHARVLGCGIIRSRGAVHDRERDARQVGPPDRPAPAHGANPTAPATPSAPARCSATRPPSEWPTSTTGIPGQPVRDLLQRPPGVGQHPGPVTVPAAHREPQPVHRDVRHLAGHRPGDRDQPEHREGQRRDLHLRIGRAAVQDQHRGASGCSGSGGCGQPGALGAGGVVSGVGGSCRGVTLRVSGTAGPADGFGPSLARSAASTQ